MFIGPLYIDSYTGSQYAVALVGVLTVVTGTVILVVAALRALLQRRFLGALFIGATALLVPPLAAVVPILGPYLEQWVDWMVYGPTYGYSPPLIPDLYWLLYGLPMTQGISWIAVGLALVGAGLGANALLPLRRRVHGGAADED